VIVVRDDISLQADSLYKLVDLLRSNNHAWCCYIRQRHHKHYTKYYCHCYDWHKDSLRNELRVKSDHVKEMQQMWYGHVKSVSDSRLSHQLLNWKPIFTRLSGRPQRCWIDNVKTAVEKLGIHTDRSGTYQPVSGHKKVPGLHRQAFSLPAIWYMRHDNFWIGNNRNRQNWMEFLVQVSSRRVWSTTYPGVVIKTGSEQVWSTIHQQLWVPDLPPDVLFTDWASCPQQIPPVMMRPVALMAQLVH